MKERSILDDPEVKAALKVLKDKGVQIQQIDLWYHLANLKLSLLKED